MTDFSDGEKQIVKEETCINFQKDGKCYTEIRMHIRIVKDVF